MTKATVYFCVALPLDDERRACIHDIEGDAEVAGHDWEGPTLGRQGYGFGTFTACTVEAIEINGVNVRHETPVADALWRAVVAEIESPNGRFHERAIDELNRVRREAIAEAKQAARDEWEAQADHQMRASKEERLIARSSK